MARGYAPDLTLPPRGPRASYAISRRLAAPSASRLTLKGTTAVVLIGVDRCGIGHDNGTRWRPLLSPENPSVEYYLTGLFVIHFLDSSTFHRYLLP
jgi:hypothetical protein